MCPQRTTLATRLQHCPTLTPTPIICTQPQQPKQQTIGDYFHNVLNNLILPTLQPVTGHPTTPPLLVTQDAITIPTPPATPWQLT